MLESTFIESAISAVQNNPNTFWHLLEREDIEPVRCEKNRDGFWEVWLRGRLPLGGEPFIYKLKFDAKGDIKESCYDVEGMVEAQARRLHLNPISRFFDYWLTPHRRSNSCAG